MGLSMTTTDALDDNIKAATTKDKRKFHVVFTETIKSKTPCEWNGAYNADVELFVEGEEKAKSFTGSTVPNAKPPKEKPDWKYSMVMSTKAFPDALRGRYYTWTRGRRADKHLPEDERRPCLRLAEKVPTVEVAGDSELMLKQLMEGIDGRSLQYATEILVHSGWSDEERGSAGCLTIEPKSAKEFFDAIPEGAEGTLEVVRGLEDPEAKKSRYY